jgi:predicted nucleotidyltransferase component of viral defense system
MFHLSTIEKETYSLLQTLFSIEEIKENFALAGGTSLALQLGHRSSIDLDIFSSHLINTREIEPLISSQHGISFDLVNP